jgi:hypothetical protein
VLSSLDKLYIVHVWKDGKKEKEKDKDKWCGGGPLLPSMRVALAKFPHQIVELEVKTANMSHRKQGQRSILLHPPCFLFPFNLLEESTIIHAALMRPPSTLQQA